MWHSNTLKGLDDALIELRHAIENLPEGPKKKQLLERFQKLQNVRLNLENPVRTERDFSLAFILFGMLILGLLILLASRKIFD